MQEEDGQGYCIAVSGIWKTRSASGKHDVRNKCIGDH
jgi:hypothetical protein